MRLNVIATGSSGNLYELMDSEGNTLIIEAGMPRGFFTTHKIGVKIPEMCIVSHGHMDHSKHKGEFEAVIPMHYRPTQCSSNNFKVVGFPAKHGESTTMLFIIKSVIENECVFFGTDFEFGDYPELFETLRICKVTKFIIECNYNDYLYHLADHLQRVGCDRHLSDNDVINFIKKANPNNPKLILIHGSNRLCADAYTKQYIGKRLPTASIGIAKGVKQKVKDLFII